MRYLVAVMLYCRLFKVGISKLGVIVDNRIRIVLATK